MQIHFRTTESGVEFPVKASPGSRKNEIRGVINGALKGSVTAPAEKGKANAAIINGNPISHCLRKFLITPIKYYSLTIEFTRRNWRRAKLI